MGKFFRKPETNQGYMLSSIKDTINSIQKAFVRESLTSRKLSTFFPNWCKFQYLINYQHPLLQKAIFIGSYSVENSTLLDESLLTIHQNYIIDN